MRVFPEGVFALKDAGVEPSVFHGDGSETGEACGEPFRVVIETLNGVSE